MIKQVKEKNQEELVKDVVCGMMKPRSEMKAKTVYKGKTYYFCTEGDKKMFDAYPDKWASQEEGGESKEE